ncbi:hypothetical protein SUGI_0999690 [Cryptomeria japonica]|uniref:uncharacterized protein LOC131046598 n=1 Tax=Cryptomeria japonica TaxID=3369 RepID=UPI0024146EB7|nr:uncharacterized protein LOC131046598 [Cryptomeria japonica]GLJ47365.1 hypothetical protein SUGI_0999690 [Cryptomeria japonica]
MQDENLIVNVPEFQNGDKFQILNEGRPDNKTLGLSVSQGVPAQDVNIYQSGDQTENCLTYETSEYLSQLPNTEQCSALDDDFLNQPLPPLDKSIVDSLRKFESETRNSESDAQMTDNENCIIDLPDGSGAIIPRQDSLGLLFREPAGLKEVDELARASMEQIEPNCIEWNAPIFSANLMDWGISQQNPKAPNPLCQSCQLMRRIIHSNGTQESRLEIHGLNGQPYHAISECRFVDDEKGSSLDCEDNRFERPEDVEQFIALYNDVRRSEKTILRYDSFVMNAITAAPESWRPASDLNPSVVQNNSVKKAGNSSHLPKSNYSAQRKRIGKLQMSEIEKYFHLPIEEAAERLQISLTALKNICRRNELARWPYRKISSNTKSIELLNLQLVGENGVINERIKSRIESLTTEIEMFYEHFNGQNKR